jgi:hypothetical protein
MMRRAALFVLAVGFCFAVAVPVQAGFIPNRATLNQFLVNPVTENFQKLPVNNDQAFDMANFSNTRPPTVNLITSLDSTTQFNWVGSAALAQGHYGPNLVVPGVTFSTKLTGSETTLGPLQWNGANYYSQPTRNLQSEQNRTINIKFAGGVPGFGVDLTAYGRDPARSDGPFPQKALVTVYDTNGVVLGSQIFKLTVTDGIHPDVIFAGFTSTGALIGSVDITTTTDSITPTSFSPNIDNVEFSANAIPEPASLTLVGTAFAGLLFTRWRRRRK